jgi:predicted negative regulator of RcsB-dependent stress response
VEYMTEEQQVERLKAFWKEYGLSIVGGIVLAIALIIGFRYYRSYKTNKAQEASLVYTTMVTTAMSNNDASANNAAKVLIKEYSSSAYADFAQLWLAKRAVDQKQYPAALKALRWVLVHGNMESVKQVTRIRLSRVYLQMQEPAKALSALATMNDKAYQGLVAELQGDAYLQRGQINRARVLYQKALKTLPNPAQSRPLLAMKLADLPATNKL